MIFKRNHGVRDILISTTRTGPKAIMANRDSQFYRTDYFSFIEKEIKELTMFCL